MTPKKRDAEMERILKLTEKLNEGYATTTVCVDSDSRDAISECWAKAKAWNTLHQNCLDYGRINALAIMDKLLPPEPTTPLGKLEAWLDDFGDEGIPKGLMRSKIAELRKEEEPQK